MIALRRGSRMDPTLKNEAQWRTLERTKDMIEAGD
jgi:hypothetical protein